MALSVRFEGEVAILGNFGGLLNDPRHFDAVGDLRALLDEGARDFVFELGGVREMGPTALGLLVTLSREIRKAGGEVVLARMSRATEKFLEEMRMDDEWDTFDGLAEAKASFRRD